MRTHHKLAFLTLTLVLLTCTGCYTVKHDGPVTVAGFSAAVLGGITFVTLAVFAVGFVMSRQEHYYEKGVMVAGVAVLFAIFILPGIFLDEVRIDDQGVYQRTGFWFFPTRKGFDFKELNSVTLSEVQKRRTTETQWALHLKTGQTRVLDPGDLWDQCAVEVAKALVAKGIPVDVK